LRVVMVSIDSRVFFLRLKPMLFFSFSAMAYKQCNAASNKWVCFIAFLKISRLDKNRLRFCLLSLFLFLQGCVSLCLHSLWKLKDSDMVFLSLLAVLTKCKGLFSLLSMFISFFVGFQAIIMALPN
jgi:hypothetical protein